MAEREQVSERALKAFTQARVEAERRWAEVRQTIQAALPTPIGVADMRRALPPETVLIAFSVGDDKSTLFMVERDARSKPTRSVFL